MGQSIVLKPNQIRALHGIGKGYGEGLSFSNVYWSPVAGAQCTWHYTTDVWDRLNSAYSVGNIDMEISREELLTYLDWFDRREKDQLELCSQFGISRPKTEAQRNLFTYLKLAQTSNYPEDIKKIK